jgi:hypothetical protein
MLGPHIADYAADDNGQPEGCRAQRNKQRKKQKRRGRKRDGQARPRDEEERHRARIVDAGLDHAAAQDFHVAHILVGPHVVPRGVVEQALNGFQAGALQAAFLAGIARIFGDAGGAPLDRAARAQSQHEAEREHRRGQEHQH